MPLVSLSDLMAEADRGTYAVPAFNAYNYETAEAIIRMAEKLHSPVIVQAYYRLFSSLDAMNLSACVRAMALQTRVPVALHLDHGIGEEEVVKAIRYGYTSVMIDGSKLSYVRNVEVTARIVCLARYVGINVEGELGRVGKGDEIIDKSAYTDPDIAADFVEKTGVDLLAVMVGSAHGAYRFEPKLDIERIALIKERTKIPLVLHGGSGIPDNEIKKAITAGIRKINVATDVCQAFYRGLRNLSPDDPAFSKPLDLFFSASKASVEEFISGRIEVFGSRGRI